MNHWTPDVLVDGFSVNTLNSNNFINATLNHPIGVSYAFRSSMIPIALVAGSVDSTSLVSDRGASRATKYKINITIDSLFNIHINSYINFEEIRTSWAITGLASDIVCYYRVRAINSAGTSDNSYVINVRTTSSIQRQVLLTVKAGWRFVSIPQSQGEKKASLVFVENFGSMFVYDGAQTRYTETWTLHLGKGLCVYLTQPWFVTLL